MKSSAAIGLSAIFICLQAASPAVAQVGHGPPAASTSSALSTGGSPEAAAVAAHIRSTANLTDPAVRSALLEVAQIGAQLSANPPVSPDVRQQLLARLQTLDSQYAH